MVDNSQLVSYLSGLNVNLSPVLNPKDEDSRRKKNEKLQSKILKCLKKPKFGRKYIHWKKKKNNDDC